MQSVDFELPLVSLEAVSVVSSVAMEQGCSRPLVSAATPVSGTLSRSSSQFGGWSQREALREVVLVPRRMESCML